MKRLFGILLVLVLAGAVSLAQPPGKSHGRGHGHGNSAGDDDDRDSGRDGGYIFSRRDRDNILSCMGGGGEGLPPGLAKRDRLPPGLERHLQKNGTLPPGLQKKVQPLPRSCQVRLPRLPYGYTRVVLGDYVILRDIHNRILDLIDLNRELGRR